MSENYITSTDERGSINISEEVISIMVAAAISEVDGVAGLASTAGTELSDFLGKKSISKGVKVQFENESITIDALIMVRYGYAVTDVAKKVQDSVASAVGAMTGMGAPVVNVHVGGVSFDKK